MTRSSRYIRARVVDFSGPEFAGEVAGPRKVSAKDRQIRRKLRRARALKRRVAHLRIRKPLGWKVAEKKAKINLRVVMSDLKALGWKPKRPSRARKPGEDEMDAALEDIPEAEPGDTEEPDEGVEELPEAPEDATEGNWLDAYVGAEPPRRNLWQEAGKLLAPKWGAQKALGDAARIQAKAGSQVMVATVSPGLFIVQVVSDAAARKIAGDNIGILPLILYPLVKDKLQKVLAPKPAAAAQPAQPAQPAAAGELGCDDRRACGS
jgi:hypothetical protein